MTLADRRTAALRSLNQRPAPAQQRYPGETQPSGDLPDDPGQAQAYLVATRWLNTEPTADARQDGAQQSKTSRPKAKQLIYLSTPCANADCSHPYNWHVAGVCQADDGEHRCGCIAFAVERQDGA